MYHTGSSQLQGLPLQHSLRQHPVLLLLGPGGYVNLPVPGTATFQAQHPSLLPQWGPCVPLIPWSNTSPPHIHASPNIAKFVIPQTDAWGSGHMQPSLEMGFRYNEALGHSRYGGPALKQPFFSLAHVLFISLRLRTPPDRSCLNCWSCAALRWGAASAKPWRP